jgi:hypothetical protein
MHVLKEAGAIPAMCALCHAAVVSSSYKPGTAKAFIKRDANLNRNDSGWYVGITDDPLNVNDPSNLALQSLYELSMQSLYELSIHDRRFTPYWLLPPGYVIEFDGSETSMRRF